ncbi:MAG: phage major capsid protein [Eggerthellaceae bacterium]|nr:phage major capsid protein [Eggerthellaceae bacterium]
MPEFTPIDINRGTTNVVLPEEVASEIWAATLEESAFMQLARKIQLPGNGLTVQTITGEPVADWVDETAAKPVSMHTFGRKAITPYKLAVIEPFSMEFVRDAAKLYAECVRRAPYALAKKFDQTILGTTAPGSNFDVLGDATTISIASNQYQQFLAADAAITAANGIMNGIALSPAGKSLVLGALDGQQRPLFTAGVESNTVGNILGAPVQVKKALAIPNSNIVGIAGDFDDALYGTVEGVKMAISDQATLTTEQGTINLWQQNMIAVRWEIEVGFSVKDKAEFVLLTNEA